MVLFLYFKKILGINKTAVMSTSCYVLLIIHTQTLQASQLVWARTFLYIISNTAISYLLYNFSLKVAKTSIN
ncbi:Hypothetical protein, predicted transmembrane protein [Ureaplasma diversum NCTC 246]|uniref:Uncharacterized protein n=1 Tax=Ureaplasma diversum NCTC 246 TaxID=1188241 RepID=A0A084EZ02_9BACT|nr:Hypothetical protein, predicted transmembrane protein [Ureaplasma diversum NCTC 246]